LSSQPATVGNLDAAETRYGGWETVSMTDYCCTGCGTKIKEGRPRVANGL
jgi:hypothetical protein